MNYILTTANGTQIKQPSITQCVEVWNRNKTLVLDYGDWQIESILPEDVADPRLPPLDKRAENWPMMCIESWADSFTKWCTQEDIDQRGKFMTAKTCEAVAHTLACAKALIIERELALANIYRETELIFGDEAD